MPQPLRTLSASAVPRLLGLLVMALVLPIVACSDSPTQPTEAPRVPVTPPDPGTAPSALTSVSDILAGTVTGEVLLAGRLTRSQAGGQDKWFFDDGTGEIVLDFPSDHVPAVNTLILVWGKVNTGPEIDVIEWAPISSVPPPPIDPPTTPPDPTPPPSLTITRVSEILAGNVFGEVIVAGQLTRQAGNDDDEWFFSDNTGEIVIDFRSDHRPTVGTPIFVWGTASSSEIDEIAWCPQASCS